MCKEFNSEVLFHASIVLIHASNALFHVSYLLNHASNMLIMVATC